LKKSTQTDNFNAVALTTFCASYIAHILRKSLSITRKRDICLADIIGQTVELTS